jgi:hypothetical protein
LDPRFKTIQDTSPEFTDHMIHMNSVFEFELLSRGVPKDPEDVMTRQSQFLVIPAVSATQEVP